MSCALALASQMPATATTAARAVIPRPTMFGRPSPRAIQSPTQRCGHARAPPLVPARERTDLGFNHKRLDRLPEPLAEGSGEQTREKPEACAFCATLAVGNSGPSKGYQNTNCGGSAKPGNEGAAASKIGTALACPPLAK